MPLYEPWMNRVYAGSVNVYAGGGTKSMARSDGALNVSAFTAGSLVADAYSTDSISAMVEGVWLYSKKGDVNIKAENNTSTEGIGYKVGGISMIDAGKTDVKSRAGTNGSVLDHDVRLTEKDLERYLIWRNTATLNDVYLLPNAARLILGTGFTPCMCPTY